MLWYCYAAYFLRDSSFNVAYTYYSDRVDCAASSQYCVAVLQVAVFLLAYGGMTWPDWGGLRRGGVLGRWQCYSCTTVQVGVELVKLELIVMGPHADVWRVKRRGCGVSYDEGVGSSTTEVWGAQQGGVGSPTTEVWDVI